MINTTNSTYPNRLNLNGMRDQLIRLSVGEMNETPTQTEERENEAGWLSDAIEIATPIARYCDKIRRGTDGRMNPLILVSPTDAWQITEVVVLSGTEGPELLHIDGDEITNTLKGMVQAIEMAAGVTQRKAA